MRAFSKTQLAGFFLIGAGAGAVAALLLAPKAGNQIRRDIRKFSKKTINQLDGLQSEIRDQITDGYAQVRKMI